jgi:hypothetical protein
LDRNGIVPLSMCRHPLDILISILHFCQYEPQTSQWIDSRGGSEKPYWMFRPSGLPRVLYTYAMKTWSKTLPVPYVRLHLLGMWETRHCPKQLRRTLCPI